MSRRPGQAFASSQAAKIVEIESNPPPARPVAVEPEARRAALHALMDRALDANPALETALDAWLSRAAGAFSTEQRTAILDMLVAGRDIIANWHTRD